jgi:hypothetical protein
LAGGNSCGFDFEELLDCLVEDLCVGRLGEWVEGGSCTNGLVGGCNGRTNLELCLGNNGDLVDCMGQGLVEHGTMGWHGDEDIGSTVGIALELCLGNNGDLVDCMGQGLVEHGTMGWHGDEDIGSTVGIALDMGMCLGCRAGGRVGIGCCSGVRLPATAGAHSIDQHPDTQTASCSCPAARCALILAEAGPCQGVCANAAAESVPWYLWIHLLQV